MCISLDSPNEHSGEPEPGHGHSSDMKPRPSARMMEDLAVFLKKHGGAFGLSYSPGRGEWMAALEFGQEAPDSPMAGGAAYGLNEVPALAVEQCLREAGI